MGAILENNAIFLSIANGKISRRVKQKTETSIERTTKDGKLVHEEIYKGWKGFITNIQTKDHPEYGKFWMITLTDETGDAILQMNYSSGYASAFLKMLPNVDFTKEVNIVPNVKEEDGKKKTTVFITQGGTALKHYWNKDNQGDLPQLNKVKVKGKITYDDSDMMEFLEKMVNEKILPKLKKVVPVIKGTNEAEPVKINDLSMEEAQVVDDDLPF